MSRADRLERLDGQRLALELQYETLLVDSLRAAAKGSWGLFDHKQNKSDRKTWQPVVLELTDLGERINEMRNTLGLNAFALHQDFLESRGPVSSHDVGEPKQAMAWLERLGMSR